MAATEHPERNATVSEWSSSAPTFLDDELTSESEFDKELPLAESDRGSAEATFDAAIQLIDKNAPGHKCHETGNIEPSETSTLARKPRDSCNHGNATSGRSVDPVEYSFVYTQISSQDPGPISQEIVSSHPSGEIEVSRFSHCQSYRPLSESRPTTTPRLPSQASLSPIDKETPELDARPSIDSRPLLDCSLREFEAFASERHGELTTEGPDSEMTPIRHSSLDAQSALCAGAQPEDFVACPSDSLKGKVAISSAEARRSVCSMSQTAEHGGAVAASHGQFGGDQNSQSPPVSAQRSPAASFHEMNSLQLPGFRTAGVGAALNPSEADIQKVSDLLGSCSNRSLIHASSSAPKVAAMFKTAGSMSNIMVSARSQFHASEILDATDVSRKVKPFEKSNGLTTSPILKAAG
jgi:hypothetical protein